MLGCCACTLWRITVVDNICDEFQNTIKGIAAGSDNEKACKS